MSDQSAAEDVGTRPPVSVPSLVGAAAGLILLGALSAFLSELRGDRLRVGGLGLSLIFEAIGVVLLVVGRDRRSNTVGVTLSALGVMPLVFFLFFDLPNGETLVGGDDVVLTSSIALLVAAGLWLAGHLFGPSRSHVLFLGAALVAVWLAITIQVVDDAAQPSVDGFGRPALRLTSASPDQPGVAGRPVTVDDDTDRLLEEYEKLDNGEVICVDGVLEAGDPTFWECEGDEAWPIIADPFATDDELRFEDDFDSQFDEDFQFDEESYYYDDPYQPVIDQWTSAGSRFGWTTLVFGAVYLGCGSLFDRRGDIRRGTAFLAVSAPLTYYGIALTGMSDVWKYGFAYMAAGGAAMLVGSASNRRFTAWLGTLAATVGLIYVVVDVVGEESSGTTFGVALLVVGLAVALGAHLLEANGSGPARLGPWSGPPSGPLSGPPSGPPSIDVSGGGDVPAGPPLAPPPASQWAPSTPQVELPPSPGSATPPTFDPRPPGSSDPLPPGPDH